MSTGAVSAIVGQGQVSRFDWDGNGVTTVPTPVVSHFEKNAVRLEIGPENPVRAKIVPTYDVLHRAELESGDWVLIGNSNGHLDVALFNWRFELEAFDSQLSVSKGVPVTISPITGDDRIAQNVTPTINPIVDRGNPEHREATLRALDILLQGTPSWRNGTDLIKVRLPDGKTANSKLLVPLTLYKQHLYFIYGHIDQVRDFATFYNFTGAPVYSFGLPRADDVQKLDPGQIFHNLTATKKSDNLTVTPKTDNPIRLFSWYGVIQ